MQETVPEELPPLVIYKHAPRAETPPPLVIRERPPTPPVVSSEPLIIERRVPVTQKQRKIIIEQIPAPPPKPRDIILEKWLPPTEQPARKVILQKNSNENDSADCTEKIERVSSAYNGIGSENKRKSSYVNKSDPILNSKQNQLKTGQQQQMNRLIDCTSGSVSYRRQHVIPKFREHGYLQHQQPTTLSTNSTTNRRLLNSPHTLNQLHSMYATPSRQNLSQGKVAGYRIIRQIIPASNMSLNDVQNVLARSSKVFLSNNITNYSNHHGIYSNPTLSASYDAHNNYASTAYNPIYQPSSVNGSTNTFTLHSNSYLNKGYPNNRCSFNSGTYVPLYAAQQNVNNFVQRAAGAVPFTPQAPNFNQNRTINSRPGSAININDAKLYRCISTDQL